MSRYDMHFSLDFSLILAQNGPITGARMRPRLQRGQIRKQGSNWELRYHEDRIVDGKAKRVRASTPLASYAEYAYKGTDPNLSNYEQNSTTRSRLF